MNASSLFIKRPVLAIIINLILMLIGFLAWQKLTIRDLPKITYPAAAIITQYSGASSEIIEKEITTPLENAFSDIANIDHMESSSMTGESVINIYFKSQSNFESDLNSIRDKLASVKSQLPDDVDAPIMQKFQDHSQQIWGLSFTDNKMTKRQLYQYVKNFILPQFQTIDGVAEVKLFGEGDPAMRIWLQPDKMLAENISINDILNKLENNSRLTPTGLLHSENFDYPLNANSTLKNINEFNQLVLKNNNGQLIKLSDVAKVRLGNIDDWYSIRVDNKSVIALVIQPQSGANAINIVDQAEKKLSHIQSQLPSGMTSKVIFNFTTSMRSALHDALSTLFITVLVVIAITFLFLGCWRTTLIPGCAIPISLVTCFAFMDMLHFSINELTLLAFILAIGLVVDDAIVVVENIKRYFDSGVTLRQAALIGSKEIVFAVIAMTLTLIAVYIPIIFINGFTGIYLQQFAFVLAVCILVSGVVAITLSPMLCSKVLQQNETKYSQWLNQQLFQLSEHYRRILIFILQKPKIIFLSFIILIMMSGILLVFLPKALAPNDDIGVIIGNISFPSNVSYSYSEKILEQAMNYFNQVPGKYSALMNHSHLLPTNANLILFLKPRHQRHQSTQQIVNELRREMKLITGAKITIFSVKPMNVSGSSGLDFQLVSTQDDKYINHYANLFIQKLQHQPALVSIENHLKFDKQQFDIHINRKAAADANVSVATITNSINTLFGGKKMGKFIYHDQLAPIIVEMQLKSQNLNQLSRINVRDDKNVEIPLLNLVSISPTFSPAELTHYDRLRSAEITANIAPGYTIANAIAEVNQIAKKILPEDLSIRYAGEAKDYLDSNHQLLMLFLLAIIFIYLVLGAQFESFLDPLIILVTVPLAVVGALFTLYLVGGSLNIFSEIGLVTLIGLVSKHGILITEFANQQLQENIDLKQAILQAASHRLRPVLMTSSAMILGALPLILSHGSGSASRHALGYTIIGGMLSGTFFSILILPSVYYWVKKLKGEFYSPFNNTNKFKWRLF